MRARVAVPRIAGRTDGPSSLIFINYWLRGIRLARAPGLLGRTAGPAILKEETALHLHQRPLPPRLPWATDTAGSAWPLECWAGQGAASVQPPPAWGLGVLEGSVQERPGGPGGPQHGLRAGKETPGPQGPSPGLRPPGSPSLLASSLRAQRGWEGESFVPGLRCGHLALQGPRGRRTPGTARSLRCLRALHSLPRACRGSRPQPGGSLRLEGSHSPARPLAGRGVG